MKKKELTQSEVARILGLSPSFVCDLRKGRRRIGKDLAFGLSKRLNIPFDKLTLLTGEPLYRMLYQAVYHRHFGAVSYSNPTICQEARKLEPATQALSGGRE